MKKKEYRRLIAELAQSDDPLSIKDVADAVIEQAQEQANLKAQVRDLARKVDVLAQLEVSRSRTKK